HLGLRGFPYEYTSTFFSTRSYNMSSFHVNTTFLSARGADVTLHPAMSGTTFIVDDPTAAFTVTLPSPTTEGLHYKFVAADEFTFYIIFRAGADQLRGYYVNIDENVTTAGT